MLLRLALAFSLLFSSQGALALCNSNDLSKTLSEAEQTRLDAELANVPFAHGTRWIATRGEKIIEVVGTVHIYDPRLETRMPELQESLESADLLLLETIPENLNNTEVCAFCNETLLLPHGMSLPDLLGDEHWSLVSTALWDREVPPFTASRFQPWVVTGMLAYPPCASAQLHQHGQGTGGLDTLLYDFAQLSGLEVGALENELAAVGYFTEQTLEEQAELLVASLVPTQAANDLATTMFNDYFDENTAEIWAANAILAERYGTTDPETSRKIMDDMQQRLIVDRNHNWMPVILNASEQHTKIVVAAGAAHLPGENGVLALLEAEGFVLERLPF